MLVTMITDASLVDKTKSGAWAMWARSERGMISGAGQLRGHVHSSGEAELKAIVNGLHVLVRSEIFHVTDTVLIQTDSQHAMKCLRNQHKPRMHEHEHKTLEHYLKLVAEHQVNIQLRHIKAHVGTAAPRNFVHDRCDRQAKRLARRLHQDRLKGAGDRELIYAEF